ncbi:hypothetical protein TEA_017366 [Camellia sinensis var. sinensis]|uniref:beta-galactosidase n=1 Tax=Camellia sinensis var. sinensis TaxID=542762 RepID=A0A4S4DJW6_CAMSN|nr:hypothetical protein TEA_017366 [Camellia sinensis var. sinensis]
MGGKSTLAVVLFVILVFEGYFGERGVATTVTYDGKALVIDGKRRILQSGSIHYPRSTPEVWPELIRKSKEGGLDVIETYIFWNYHEPVKGEIENEYGNVEWAYGIEGQSYVKWAAEMAVGLNTTVPWVMCVQKDAPDPVINTCNGFYCDRFTPNSPSKPKMWTENYSGWFLSFGYAVPYRPVEDLAFAVARFFETGGTFQNYYMVGLINLYFGGTNFGRTAGGPLIATSYDYDAPLDEYGFIRQPKFGHLRDLHLAIKQCEEYLVNANPIQQSLGRNLEAHVYYKTSNDCAAFLANYDSSSGANVTFNGNSYFLPAWVSKFPRKLDTATKCCTKFSFITEKDPSSWSLPYAQMSQ